MLTSNTPQQCLADAGSDTRPLMLERGSCIPWASLDSCNTAKSIWERVERLMRGTMQNKVDRETRFNNEFDQFVVEPGEALVSVYNRFAQLMNDLERNGIKFPHGTVNTKFLNFLQPKWLKYVTQVCLTKRLTKDSYDDLFDYLKQFEKLVNTSRVKKLEESHDPLALVAHTGSSSRTTSLYYVTHPSSVVDYDDDYQGDAVQKNSKDTLTSIMILLARAITQRFSDSTNNHIRTSSNTKNKAIVQADKRNLRTTSLGTASNVQCYNCSEKGTECTIHQLMWNFIITKDNPEEQKVSEATVKMVKINDTFDDDQFNSNITFVNHNVELLIVCSADTITMFQEFI
ncbi:hypothetical protein Tco_0928658 [Tanacetum coccineum]